MVIDLCFSSFINRSLILVLFLYLAKTIKRLVPSPNGTLLNKSNLNLDNRCIQTGHQLLDIPTTNVMSCMRVIIGKFAGTSSFLSFSVDTIMQIRLSSKIDECFHHKMFLSDYLSNIISSCKSNAIVGFFKSVYTVLSLYASENQMLYI